MTSSGIGRGLKWLAEMIWLVARDRNLKVPVEFIVGPSKIAPLVLASIVFVIFLIDT
jgi:hypothetical protein